MDGSPTGNNTTPWPNLQVKTCKNPIKVGFQVGPSVAITRDQSRFYQSKLQVTAIVVLDQDATAHDASFRSGVIKLFFDALALRYGRI